MVAPGSIPGQSDGLGKVIDLGKDAIRFGDNILKTVKEGKSDEKKSKAPPPPPDEPDPAPADDLVDGTGKSKSLPDPDTVPTPD